MDIIIIKDITRQDKEIIIRMEMEEITEVDLDLEEEIDIIK